jgi:hypothetical protein
MWKLLCFWGRCLLQGWQLGHSVSAFIQVAAFLVIGTLEWRKGHEDVRKKWEDPVKRWAYAIFVVCFVFSAGIVAPYLQYHDLELRNKELKRQIAKAVNPLRQQAVKLGNQLVDFVDQERANGKSDEDIKKDYILRFDNQVKTTVGMMDAAGLHSDAFDMTTWWSPDARSIRACGDSMRRLASTLPDTDR